MKKLMFFAGVFLIYNYNAIAVSLGISACLIEKAETLTAKSYWPFPTYADLLFGVK